MLGHVIAGEDLELKSAKTVKNLLHVGPKGGLGGISEALTQGCADSGNRVA